MVVMAIFACGLVIMMTGVRLTWAMSRDERFPGWQQWSQISPRFHTPLKATVLFVVLAELILAIFSQFGDGAVHAVRRRDAAARGDLCLDGGAVPGQAQVSCRSTTSSTSAHGRCRSWWSPWSGWCSNSRCSATASFKEAWLYVIVMVVIGACLSRLSAGHAADATGWPCPTMALHRRRARRTKRRRTAETAADDPRPGHRPGHLGHQGDRRRRRRPGRRRSPRSRCGRSTCRAAASSRIPRRCGDSVVEAGRRALGAGGRSRRRGGTGQPGRDRAGVGPRAPAAR